MKRLLALSLLIGATSLVLGRWLGVDGEPTAPASIGKDHPAAAPELRPAPSLADPSARRPTAGEPTGDPSLAAQRFEEIRSLLEREDVDGLGVAVEAWLHSHEDPIEGLTTLLYGPLLTPMDGSIAGLLLQAGMRFALAGSPLMNGIDPADLALLALGSMDASVHSTRALQMGLGPLAAELPGELIGDLLEVAYGSPRAHNEVHNTIDRVALLQRWAKGMGAGAETTLTALAQDPGTSMRVRSAAMQGLMNRDWRRFAPEMKQLFDTLRDQGLDVRSGAGYSMLLDVTGTDLDLLGRERLELLREVLRDDELATQALCDLPVDMRRDLLSYADDGDRHWGPFRWVALAGEGDEAIEAGWSLIEDSREDPNVARGYLLVHRLMELDANEPRLDDELEWRFSNREEGDDLFWGLFEFNLLTLPREVRQQRIPHYLAMTRGETHPTRLRVLDRLRTEHPEWVSGLQ